MEQVLLPVTLPPAEPSEVPWLRPLVRWGLRDYAVRLHRVLTPLEQQPPRTFDPTAYCRAFEASLPRWQLVGRGIGACAVESWGKAILADLRGELTERVLEERAGTPGRDGYRPSREFPGLEWRRTTEGPSARWSLDARLEYSLRNEPPLAYTVHAGECGGA